MPGIIPGDNGFVRPLIGLDVAKIAQETLEECDKKSNLSVAGIRPLIESVGCSEATLGTLPALKPERQDACGGGAG